MPPRDFAFWAKSPRGQQKTRRKKHTLKPHSLKPISRKETTVQPIKATEGSSEKRRHAHLSNANSEPNKTAVQPTKATEGEQREGRHTHSSKKKKQNQEEHSTANKGDRGRHTRIDRNEKSHQRPYRYDHWLPIGVRKNSASAETENV